MLNFEHADRAPLAQATLKFIEMKLRAPSESLKAGKIPLGMESKAVIIRVLQRFQANAPQELRAEVAVVTRLALTGHSGRFPEDIETEASDKYKEARPSMPFRFVTCACFWQSLRIHMHMQGMSLQYYGSI